jgi:3-oxoacyl-[acyl-carrier protein] reductase
LKAGEAAGKEELAKAIKQKQEGGTPPEKAAELAVFLASSQSDGLTGRLISAVWDDWKNFDREKITDIMNKEIFTLRRIDEVFFYPKVEGKDG